MGAMLLQGLVDYGPIGEKPALLAVFGWAALGAVMAAIVVDRETGWTVPAFLLVSAGVLAAMFVAYDRDGGWPGVAGWEFRGMESPIVVYPTAVLILLAPPVAGLLRFTRPALQRFAPVRRTPPSPDAGARVATPG